MKILLPFLVFILLGGPLLADPHSLLSIDETRLRQGAIQILHDNAGRPVGVLLIEASPEAVWSIISDWPRSARLNSGISYNRIIQREDGRSIIEGRFDLELFKSQYTLAVCSDEKNRHQKWQLLTDSEIKALQAAGLKIKFSGAGIGEMHGYHYLRPFDSGRSTIYYCAPVVTSSIPLPEFARRRIQQTILNQHMAAVKKDAERPLHPPIAPVPAGPSAQPAGVAIPMDSTTDLKESPQK